MPLALLLLALCSGLQAAEQRWLVPPHEADARLAQGEVPHLVVYDSALPDAPMMVWLSGTGGKPASGPRRLYETALRQGYRVLALSYLNTPAVSQVCAGATLRSEPDCAARLRQHRVWGQPLTRLLADQPEDAIVPRLTGLLQHLARTDPAGQWAQYLDGDEPRWGRLPLAGQSQGGGMAAFIAQTREVAGVAMFSGGWDHRAGGELADWYGRPSATPPQRWHGSLHAQEPQAAALAQVYRKLGLPAAQVHVLSQPLKGPNPHVEGIGNVDYVPVWEQMLPSRR